MMNPKIYIIGAGAVGKALAVFLQKQSREVVLVRGSVDHPEEENKITIDYKGESVFNEQIKVTGLNGLDQLNGLVVLTNKSYGNRTLAERLKEKTGDSPLILMQNGLGVERPFLEAGFPEVYRCILFLASQTEEGGTVSYKPVTTSPIGGVHTAQSNLEEIVKTLDNPYMPFKVEEGINAIVWEKAVLNTVFNSICPLLEIDNGIFQRDQRVMSLARRIIVECRTVAREQGVALNQDEMEQKVLMISQMSDGQLISTLQDIRRGSRTEIDTLNLEIARLSSKGDQVMETRLLGEMIQLRSELAMAAAS